jgi:cell wall-associated NlpC family hydrolase
MDERITQFVAAAHSIAGAPYVHQGRGPHNFDCIGAALHCALQAGLITREEFDSVPADYPPQPQGAEMVRALRALLIRLPDGAQAEPADLLLIQFSDEPQHLLLVVRATIAGPEVVHAVPHEGVSRPFRCDQLWLRGRGAKLTAVYRWKSLA